MQSVTMALFLTIQTWQQLNQKIEELAQAGIAGTAAFVQRNNEAVFVSISCREDEDGEQREADVSTKEPDAAEGKMQQMQQQAQMQQQQKMAELQTKEKIAQMESDSRIKAGKINAEGIVRANMDTVNAKLRMNTDSLQAETLQSMEMALRSLLTSLRETSFRKG